jgi:hypothetical protein
VANPPVSLGQEILVATASVNHALRPAKVVNIPLYLPDGLSNFDEFGNPHTVDVLIFTMSGLIPKYRIRHQQFGDTDYWVEETAQ